MEHRRTEGGLVLIAVVFALTAMAGLVLALHAKVGRCIGIVDALTQSAKALGCAQAGLEAARAMALSWQREPKVGPLEVCFALGDGKCNLEVSDEQGRFNLNTLLAPDGTPDKERLVQLRRLVGLAGIEDGSTAEKIMAWLVRHRRTGGQDQEGCVIGSIDEVLAIMYGIDRQVLYKLLPYVTVYGDGLVELNAAPEVVLRACIEDQDLADRVVAMRTRRPFDLAELQGIGLDQGAGSRLKSFLTVRPSTNWLRVRAIGRAGAVERRIWAIIHTNPSAGTADVVSYWEQLYW